jgi:exopolyphosphatase/guanosine-5'-triphosphate,3'-diphosphate pyrophosphatase
VSDFTSGDTPERVDVGAVIDCGSGATRLLVIDRAGRVLDRRTLITGLATGVAASGRLGSDAIGRVADCVGEYAAVAAELGADVVRIVSTSAARDAANRDELFGTLEAVSGVRPDLLSGEAEARYSFAGATAGLDPTSGPFLVADIGGGSTELVVGDTDVVGLMSADIGSVRLTEAYIENDPARPEELLACLSLTEAYLDDLARTHPQSLEATQLIGVAGTVTAAAAVELGIEDPDAGQIHHFRLSKEAAEDVFRTIATEDRAQRLTNPGLEPDRVDVFVAGMCILVKIMRFFDFEECLVSETDLLDGVAADLFE